ncbi:PEP-CTERM sorting domain-containing protein [Haloferula sp.]|uniref:PEP-CTERM sorting domain-containing protein n=1 Tax=Haloferula sp. TaxID=2497595 RepID=UPI003C7937C2
MNRISKFAPLPLASLAGLALVTASSNAAITYVDAQKGSSGNTYATGGSLAVTTWAAGNSTSANDTQWKERIEGNGGNLFEALPNGSSANIPELTTELTGLDDGTYDIWVFFWDQVTNDTQNWTISAGMETGDLTTYSAPGQPAVAGATTVGVSDASTLSFTNTSPTVFSSQASGNQGMYGVKIGQKIVSGGSEIEVFIGMELDGSTTDSRARYDGLGYELIPEPSSVSLIGLGCAAFLMRRRR